MTLMKQLDGLGLAVQHLSSEVGYGGYIKTEKSVMRVNCSTSCNWENVPIGSGCAEGYTARLSPQASGFGALALADSFSVHTCMRGRCMRFTIHSLPMTIQADACRLSEGEAQGTSRGEFEAAIQSRDASFDRQVSPLGPDADPSYTHTSRKTSEKPQEGSKVFPKLSFPSWDSC